MPDGVKNTIGPAWPVKAFLLALAIPWVISLGGLSLSAHRLVLLGTILPCLVSWAAGRLGRIRFADVSVLLYALWCGLTLATNHGLAAASQPAGILIIETLGAYFLARRYITDDAAFRATIAFASKLILCLFPFALIEWVTGVNILMSVASKIAPTFEFGLTEVRMGFYRVRGPFFHPIVFGVFIGSLLTLALMVLRGTMSNGLRALLVLTIGWTAFTSMSSAPIAGLLLQIFLICWHYALRENPLRWKILWALIFLAYLVIEFGSNQTPIQFYISKFTFDQQTGWYRIWIWEHGSTSVLNNPWLGIGLNDWVRPKWMYSDSVDNFWLLTAMRHGLPALLFLAAACMATWRGIARRVGKDADLETAYLICMAMFVFVGSTVHFWGAVYVWFMFLLGAGVCMIEPKQVKTVEAGSSEEHQNVHRSRAGSVRPVRTLIKQ